MKNKLSDWTPEQIRNFAETSETIQSLMKKLGYKSTSNGVSRMAVKTFLSENKINLPSKRHEKGVLNRDEIIQMHFKIYSPNSPPSKSTIRSYVRQHKLIECKCLICGLGETWNGLPLTLELDHINGDTLDNRIRNLRFLCPNCHQQQPTSHRNKPRVEKPREAVVLEKFRSTRPENARQFLAEFGLSDCTPNYNWLYNILYKNGVVEWNETFRRKWSKLDALARQKQRRYEHPDPDVLRRELEQFPIEKIAIKYRVSGSAIRKLCKKYRIETKHRGYWAKVQAGKPV